MTINNMLARIEYLGVDLPYLRIQQNQSGHDLQWQAPQLMQAGA